MTFNFDSSRLFEVGNTPLNVAWGAEYREEGYQIKPGEPVSHEDGGALNPVTGEAYAPGFQVFRGQVVTVYSLRNAAPSEMTAQLP